MRNKVVIYNEVFGKNKGKSSQLLNENEWIQSSALVELKVLLPLYKNQNKYYYYL